MDQNIMQDRINKFNKDFYNKSKDENGASSANKLLLSAREKNSLKLRKDKLEEQIMKKRMNSYLKNYQTKSDTEKFKHLYIPLEELLPYLPEYLDMEFNSYDEKYEKVKEFLEDYLKNRSSELNVTREAYLRYGLVKLRDLSMLWGEDMDNDQSGIDTKLVEYLIQILITTDDVRIQYELTHIFINLTYYSDKFTNFLIEDEFLQTMYRLLNSKEPGIIDNSLWILANLFDNDEQCNLILTCLPELTNRINIICQEYSNILEHFEILKNVTWLIYRIIIHDPDKAGRFLPSLNCLLNFLDHEVSNLLLLKEMKDNSNQNNQVLSDTGQCPLSNNKEENSIFNNILLIFNRFLINLDDKELYLTMLNSTLIKNLVTLIKDFSALPIDDQDLLMIFRVLGGILLGLDSDETEILLSYGIIEKFEEYFEYCLTKSIFNKKLIKELTWAISNITGGALVQVDRVILRSKLPILLFKIYEKFRNPLFVNELMHVFYNAFDLGSKESKIAIINEQILNLITENLHLDGNVKITKLSLEFMRMILEQTKTFDLNMHKHLKRRFEGLNIPDILEKLQFHNDEDIARIAEVILMDSWNLEELYLLNTKK
jgi:hypothetical protein